MPQKFVGAHVSAAGGLHNAITNMLAINATSAAFFLKARKWAFNPLPTKVIDDFHRACEEHNVDKSKLMPHGQYIVNLASPEEDKRQRSYEYFKDDVERCSKLGIQLYNIHPGSTVGKCSLEEGIDNLAGCINSVLSETEGVTIVLENMAGHGNIIGGTFEELAEIISRIEDKDRVGVCIDTCHSLAAGYDLRSFETFQQTWKSFDKVVGFQFLKALHLNDSKTDLNSKRDLHENIGKGYLGREPFEWIMKSEWFDDIPLILETPVKNDDDSIYAEEIKLLRSFEER